MTSHAIAQFIKKNIDIETVEIDGQSMDAAEGIKILEARNKLWPDIQVLRSPDWKILTIITNENE